MVSKLKDNNLILSRLYEDCVRHVEEISLIEESYLWQNISVYVDDNESPKDFLIVRSFSHQGEQKIGAYMAAEAPSSIQGFFDILGLQRDFQVHLQASVELGPSIKKSLGWLKNSYIVRYCRADSHTFKPFRLNEGGIILLTPDNITKFKPMSTPHLVKRAETAPIYGFVNEKGEMVASSGVGFLTKKSFSISYTETSPEYRNRGLAKCLTSLAAEPLIKRQLIGVYCYDTNNKPAIRLASALGFLPYMEMTCFFS